MISNYLKTEINEYKQLQNNLKNIDKFDVCFNICDLLIKKYKKLEKNSFLKINHSFDELVINCQKKLKNLYFNKMHSILSDNDYEYSFISMKSMLDNLHTCSSTYFNGILSSFIKDVTRVIDKYNIIYNNYQEITNNLGKCNNCNNIIQEFDYFSLRYDTDLDFEEEDILNRIDNEINGYEFEKITKQLLQKNGFQNVIVTQASNDFGVDVLAVKDEIKYAIQCKKYSSSVGVKAVQEVIASKAMHNCHVAVVLTNNSFTKSAIKLAEKNNVLLWDRNDLIAMIDKVNSL